MQGAVELAVAAAAEPGAGWFDRWSDRLTSCYVRADLEEIRDAAELSASLTAASHRIFVAVAPCPWVGAGDDVSPVGPGAVRERPHRADVEVVTAEWDGSAAELLPVWVARHVAEPDPGRP